MILIIDNTHRKMRGEIRAALVKARIPCVVTDLDHSDVYMPAALTVVTEKYLYDDAKYISKLNSNDNVVLWDETSDIFRFLYLTYSDIYGDIFENSKIGRVRTNGKEVIFCGKPLHFTSTEHRILNLLQYSPRWYQREAIAAYCLKEAKSDETAVTVHICNMNSKANRATGHELILCKRYMGYSLNVF